MATEKNKWYCYVCGKRIDTVFQLWSMQSSTDRVFIACGKKCSVQLEDTPVDDEELVIVSVFQKSQRVPLKDKREKKQ